MSDFGFSTQGHKATEERKIIPEGYYTAEIKSIEAVTGKDNPQCKMFKTAYKILDEEYAGLQVFAHHIYKHQKKSVQAGGCADLTALCAAVGLPDGFEDPEELRAIPLVIRIKISPAKDGYDAGNEVKFWMSEEAFSKSDNKKHVLGAFERQPGESAASSSKPKQRKERPARRPVDVDDGEDDEQDDGNPQRKKGW